MGHGRRLDGDDARHPVDGIRRAGPGLLELPSLTPGRVCADISLIVASLTGRSTGILALAAVALLSGCAAGAHPSSVHVGASPPSSSTEVTAVTTVVSTTTPSPTTTATTTAPAASPGPAAAAYAALAADVDSQLGPLFQEIDSLGGTLDWGTEATIDEKTAITLANMAGRLKTITFPAAIQPAADAVAADDTKIADELTAAASGGGGGCGCGVADEVGPATEQKAKDVAKLRQLLGLPAAPAVNATPGSSTSVGAVVTVNSHTNGLSVEENLANTQYVACRSFTATSPTDAPLSLSDLQVGTFGIIVVDSTVPCVSAVSVLAAPQPPQCATQGASGIAVVGWVGYNQTSQTVLYQPTGPNEPVVVQRWCQPPTVVDASGTAISLSRIAPGAQVRLSLSADGWVTAVALR